MTRRLPRLGLLTGLLCLVGCADLTHEPLQASRDENAQPTETPTASPTNDVDPISFGLVVDVEGEPLVVLRGEPDGSWSAGEGAGAATLVSTGGVYVARRDAALDLVSAAAKRQLGRKLALFDDHGLRCEAVVSGLSWIVRADPRYDTREEWEGKGYSGRTTKATDAEIAQEVWSMSAPQLVAQVRAVKGACAGAMFARSATLSTAKTAIASAADPATTARVALFARTTQTYLDVQRRYAADAPIPGDPPRPTLWEDLPYVTTEVVTMHAGASTYAWITVAAEAGCGEFNARYGALIREDVTAPGGFIVVESPDSYISEKPRALVDLGDGAPTMLFESAALRPEGGVYRFESQTVSSMECPC
ncbi:MAG: hypothetical protein ABI175_05825 [Polyangiales bacterium]